MMVRKGREKRAYIVSENNIHHIRNYYFNVVFHLRIEFDALKKSNHEREGERGKERWWMMGGGNKTENARVRVNVTNTRR